LSQLRASISSSDIPDIVSSIHQNIISSDLLSSTLQSSYSSMLLNLDDFSQSFLNDVPSASLLLFTAVLAGYGQDDNNIGAPGTTYDAKRYDEFYGSKPLYVLRRLARLISTTATFNVRLLLDYLQGNLDKNAPERAKEALQLATILGPTFIKLGQALAIRTDLLPKAYGMELSKLQDSVAPFDSEIAKEIIKKELKVKSLDEVFSKFPDKPIASASIGQVYRATMKDGTEVAVKVQRPNILNEIALDLYLLRLLTPIQVWVSNLVNKQKTIQSDVDAARALVDEWGRGFVNEVDYRLEAVNTKQFLASMIERQLDAVTAPRVIDALSVDKILTTEWMEGTRLDSDASPDVPRLCGVAVNAYLTMLLDNGIMHCDPHPGNLLRTLDGRLCILDWGMTVSVPKDLQYSLLEFIAHVNAEDFDSIPQDFVNLGFSPASKINQLRSSGITEGVSITFRQLNKGGGPTKIRERVFAEFQTRYGANLTSAEIRERAQAELMDRMSEDLKQEGVDVSGVTGAY